MSARWSFVMMMFAWGIGVLAPYEPAYARGGRFFRGRYNTNSTTPINTGSSEVTWQRNNWGVAGFGRNYGGASNGYGGYYYGPNSNHPIPGGFPGTGGTGGTGGTVPANQYVSPTNVVPVAPVMPQSVTVPPATSQPPAAQATSATTPQPAAVTQPPVTGGR